jgi:spermidine/putrescine transport system ATP-binding protein
MLSVRPEAIRLAEKTPQDAALSGLVTHRIFLGSSAEYVVDVPGLGDLLVSTAGEAGGKHFDIGGEVAITIDPAAPHVFSQHGQPQA